MPAWAASSVTVQADSRSRPRISTRLGVASACMALATSDARARSMATAEPCEPCDTPGTIPERLLRRSGVARPAQAGLRAISSMLLRQKAWRMTVRRGVTRFLAKRQWSRSGWAYGVPR